MKKEKEIIKGFKGFEKDFKCRDFQFEIGKEYKTTGEIKCCNNGFHFCENPLDVLDHYPLLNNDCEFNKFAIVEGTGDIDREEKKVAVSNLNIIKELKLGDFINNSIEVLTKENDPRKTSGDNSQLASSGDNSQLASSGDYSQLASSGNNSKLASSGYNSQLASSGNNSQLASSGYNSQLASSGDYSQLASSGDNSKLASSGDNSQLASSGYNSQLASSGDYSQLASSGNNSKLASSGYNSQLASSGKYSIICCAGRDSIAKGKKGNWITLSEWEYDNKLDDYIPICVKTKKIDGKIIKEDTWYKLENKKFVEVEND